MVIEGICEMVTVAGNPARNLRWSLAGMTAWSVEASPHCVCRGMMKEEQEHPPCPSPHQKESRLLRRKFSVYAPLVGYNLDSKNSQLELVVAEVEEREQPHGEWIKNRNIEENTSELPRLILSQ